MKKGPFIVVVVFPVAISLFCMGGFHSDEFVKKRRNFLCSIIMNL